LPSEPPFNPDDTAVIRRTDAGSRKIIDRIDSMRDEIADLKADQRNAVRWDKLAVTLGSAATVIIGGAWAITKSSEARTDRIAAEQLRAIRSELAEIRRADMPKVEAYAKASAQVLTKDKSPAEAKKELAVSSALDGGTR
jgi:hypothetical protein